VPAGHVEAAIFLIPALFAKAASPPPLPIHLQCRFKFFVPTEGLRVPTEYFDDPCCEAAEPEKNGDFDQMVIIVETERYPGILNCIMNRIYFTLYIELDILPFIINWIFYLV